MPCDRTVADSCPDRDKTIAYALGSLPPAEARGMESHIGSCRTCRQETASVLAFIEKLAAWPTDVLGPTDQLRNRLAARIAGESSQPGAPPAGSWSEPDWEHVAPGIDCKLLAMDGQQNRVSMLVRLAADASYPPHTHAATEELYLLGGELWIDDRKLVPGDFNRGAPGGTDHRVRSGTGCTCLLITSTQDVLLA